MAANLLRPRPGIAVLSDGPRSLLYALLPFAPALYRRTGHWSSNPRRFADWDVRLGAVYGRLSVGKGFFEHFAVLVGAAMYPTYRCGSSCAAGHNAIRAAQVPIASSHSKVHGPIGFS
ncbi:protein of unknown function [Aminobacter niigataensis]|nr:protein of unknown function [Aminobacter niigataensis]